ncbi:MAG: hypothetical protein M5R36_03965 [Deltaproteobacteria bacterium]|nr:hypothetical protein [Deltaproteobacteria bacterium]
MDETVSFMPVMRTGALGHRDSDSVKQAVWFARERACNIPAMGFKTADILRSAAALPVVALLLTLAGNEYFFAPWMSITGCAAIIAAGLVFRARTQKRASIPFWLIVFLSAYNFPLAAGGYVFLKYWSFAVAPLCFGVGWFVYFKAHAVKRMGFGVVLASLFRHFLLHFQRHLDFDASLGRCAAEREKLPASVRVIDETRHPYDFAMVTPEAGPRLLAAAYGWTGRLRFWDAESETFVREAKIATEGEIQRLTPSEDGAVLYVPPWSRREDEETILVFDVASGGVVSELTVPHCRNLFDIVIGNAPGELFALCETSHTLVRLTTLGDFDKHVRLPGRDAYDVALNGRFHRLFTTDYWSPYVTVVRAGKLTVERTIRVGWSTFGALSSGDRVFVARPLASEVVEIDAKSLEVARRFDVGYGVRDLEIDAKRDVLFAGNYFDGTLDAVDLGSGERLSRVFVGKLLRGLYFDAETDCVYAATGCGIKAVGGATLRGAVE